MSSSAAIILYYTSIRYPIPRILTVHYQLRMAFRRRPSDSFLFSLYSLSLKFEGRYMHKCIYVRVGCNRRGGHISHCLNRTTTSRLVVRNNEKPTYTRYSLAVPASVLFRSFHTHTHKTLFPPLVGRRYPLRSIGEWSM